MACTTDHTDSVASLMADSADRAEHHARQAARRE